MKRFAYLACTLALAACGSSGGGDNNNAGTPAAKPSDNSAVTPSTNNNANQNVANSVNTQFYVNKTSSDTAVTFPNAEKISVIKVDGAEFDLANLGFSSDWGMQTPNIRSGAVKLPQNVSHIITYNGSPNVVAGVLRSTTTGNDYAYFNGKFTDVAKVPTSNSATYNVRSAYFTNGSQNLGRASLVADFGAKTLMGTVPVATGNADLKATINGNRFASENGAALYVKGGFFGENAEEIGGVYKDANTVGAFAGSK